MQPFAPQAYTEWTFRGTSSGRFRFKGDPTKPPPQRADFAAALKKHTGQLSALVASAKGWTVKIVSKGTGSGGPVAYVARYRYKKKDFMPKLEKVRRSALFKGLQHALLWYSDPRDHTILRALSSASTLPIWRLFDPPSSSRRHVASCHLCL